MEPSALRPTPSPLPETADAAVDAAKAATARFKDVADDVDFDSLVAHTKTVAGA